VAGAPTGRLMAKRTTNSFEPEIYHRAMAISPSGPRHRVGSLRGERNNTDSFFPVDMRYARVSLTDHVRDDGQSS
jgi:hypothetical protein